MLILLSIVTILFSLACLILYIVPPYTFDVPEVLGKLKPVRKSGLRAQIPLLTKHRFVSTKAFLLSDRIVFIASDNIEVTAPINMLVAADADINVEHGDLKGTNRFASIERADLLVGLRDAVGAEMTAIGNSKTSKDCKKGRLALTALANCKSRLSYMPHKRHNPATCGVAQCQLPAGVIPAEQIIEFYEVHEAQIHALLAGEKALADRSDVEMLFGVDVEEVTFADFLFSGETVKAGELEEQAKLRRKAAQPVIDLAQALTMKEDGGLGLSGSEAMNTALHLLTGTPKSVITFEGMGEGGILGVAAAKLAAGAKKEEGQ